jgi:hypothetical protein
MSGQGQYDRYRDMDREEDWDEWDEPTTTWTYAEYWFVPGPYAGIGPRNYNRSDETILEEVCERLSQHGQVDASEIEVEIQDGDVILKGSVNDRREKRLAEDIAESVFGIVDVQNHLRTQDRQLGGVESCATILEGPRASSRAGWVSSGLRLKSAQPPRVSAGTKFARGWK